MPVYTKQACEEHGQVKKQKNQQKEENISFPFSINKLDGQSTSLDYSLFVLKFVQIFHPGAQTASRPA